jgi:sporulation protein YlmC with PRC-barrel domain
LSGTTPADSTEFTIGGQVTCSDGVCGDLRRVVVDPTVRKVTHLVVEPKKWPGLGRLVPIDLVDMKGTELRLRCTLSQFEALEEADEILVAPGVGGQWGFGLGMGGMGAGNASPQVFVSDRVPAGDVEVHRGDHVHATDGVIGKVQGLVVNSADHRVIDVLLAEGHLWGQKRVLIPISAVTSVDDGVRLNLTKDEVRDLTSVDNDPD